MAGFGAGTSSKNPKKGTLSARKQWTSYTRLRKTDGVTPVNVYARDGAVDGDTFGNREGLLPNRPANSYAVADLDYVEGYRGAARIVYDRRRTSEGAIWVTVDHYDSFAAVPLGQYHSLTRPPMHPPMHWVMSQNPPRRSRLRGR